MKKVTWIASFYALLALLTSVLAEPTLFRYVPLEGEVIRSVSLRGEMNSWGESPMTEQTDGSWEIVIDLDPGLYAYKFYINAQWPSDMSIGRGGSPIDADASDYQDDGYGGKNALRQVEGAPKAAAVVTPTTASTVAATSPSKAIIHYQRPDADYEDWGLHVWEDTTEEVTWQSPLAPAGEDDYGIYWEVNLKENAQKLGFIVHQGDSKDPGPDMFLEFAEYGAEIWLQSGSEIIYTSPDSSTAPAVKLDLPEAAPLAEGYARLHYHRPDGNYEGWGLHVWEDTLESVTWQNPLASAGQDSYGIYFDVALKEAGQKLGFIVHKGDNKDPGPDMFLDLTVQREVWLLSGSSVIYDEKIDTTNLPKGDLTRAKGHWLDSKIFAWDIARPQDRQIVLAYSPDASLTLSADGISGEKITLSYESTGLSSRLQETFPHLKDLAVFSLPEAAYDLATILKSQMALVALDAEGKVVDATGLQIPGVLDSLYTYEGELGLNWHEGQPQFSLWAPTAQKVRLHIFDNPNQPTARGVLDMQETEGVWSLQGRADWKGKFYLYEVTVYVPSTGKIETNLVTDPYSLSLSLNSRHSMIIDMADESLKPAGWDNFSKPELASFSDISLYELHIRDFSSYDESVPEAWRGTFKAFTVTDSAGMKHLRALAEAGLSHVHLLPVFDIATINEDKSTWQQASGLEDFAPDSAKQQELVNNFRDQDGFNWGYDPLHYNTPEGSYSSDPNGAARVLEFREMVMALNASGLRVVMDVVYNHTNASGQNPLSVLDRVVPGYYHRLNGDGFVETSTCCQNTATEHAMMERLMVDSLEHWSKHYKVDGFRFDLMGHHMLSNMQAAKTRLESLTLAQDGVDGSKIYLYGEGWNFGEVANNQRGINATQLNLFGSGIGSFNDRIRDAVRGGGPFSGLQEQGFASGLYTAPANGMAGSLADENKLLSYSDQIRVGLAGNLADYTFLSSNNQMTKGSAINYGGSFTGYAASPLETINYVSAHDNETLFDALNLKLALDTSMEDRVRSQVLALSLVALGQGVPFFHAGSDILRSKSMDRDSYNSGDWFNHLDFSYQDNGWGRGLPIADKNQNNWPIMKALLANPALKPSQADILAANERFREFLAIRYSSKLFRMESLADIQAHLSFLASDEAGLITMLLSDGAGEIDPQYRRIVVFFNASPELRSLELSDLAGGNFGLHPLQKASSDRVLGLARYSSNGRFIIPARSTAVFVELR
ncbi:MAG: pullulanase-type alpha-1,6-glucosidase [Deinococcales bacterium]